MVTSTSARTQEEADKAKEALVANAVAVVKAIVETTYLLNIHLKEN